MAERMTVVVRGRDGLTVEDAMRQVLDTFELLGNTSPLPDQPIVWRLVSASTNSPLTVVAEAVAALPGFNPDPIAHEQKREFRRCFAELRAGRVPATWNSAESRRKAKGLLARTHNGISALEIFDEASAVPITVTAADAALGEPALEQAAVVGRPRESVGSVEGFLVAVTTYYGKPAIRIRIRRTDAEVTCVVPEEFRQRIVSAANFDDVWRERRVRIRGRLHHTSAGPIERIVATTVEMMPEREIDPRALRDASFTSGLSVEEYLKRFREGEIG